MTQDEIYCNNCEYYCTVINDDGQEAKYCPFCGSDNLQEFEDDD